MDLDAPKIIAVVGTRKATEYGLKCCEDVLQELGKNKMRTFLSLFGVTIGIFCIIGVLSTVSSLEKNIQDGIKSLGNNTIYIDKWDYQGGADYPWWKFVKRPSPKIAEMDFVKKKSELGSNMAFFVQTQESFTNQDNILKGDGPYTYLEKIN